MKMSLHEIPHRNFNGIGTASKLISDNYGYRMEGRLKSDGKTCQSNVTNTLTLFYSLSIFFSIHFVVRSAELAEILRFFLHEKLYIWQWVVHSAYRWCECAVSVCVCAVHWYWNWTFWSLSNKMWIRTERVFKYFFRRCRCHGWMYWYSIWRWSLLSVLRQRRIYIRWSFLAEGHMKHELENIVTIMPIYEHFILAMPSRNDRTRIDGRYLIRWWKCAQLIIIINFGVEIRIWINENMPEIS